MGFFDSFRSKKKKPARAVQKVRTQQKPKQRAVVESDVKFAHIMKEFGSIQKDLKEVKRALGMLKEAEERTFSEIQEHPARLSAVIEREIGEISRKMDEIVIRGPSEPSGKPLHEKVKMTPLMRSILEVLDSGSMQSGEIYKKLMENEVRVHEKSVPRALKGLISNGMVKVNSSGGGYTYEKSDSK